MSDAPQIIHGTAVAIGDAGVLLIGRSGSGKSDLALRLIDRGAVLVSDDAVEIVGDANAPFVKVAPNIAGKIEMRGVGLIVRPFAAKARLQLVVLLDEPPERMPDLLWHRIEDADIPALRLHALEASAPLKVEEALKQAVDGGRPAVAGEAPKP